MSTEPRPYTDCDPGLRSIEVGSEALLVHHDYFEEIHAIVAEGRSARPSALFQALAREDHREDAGEGPALGRGAVSRLALPSGRRLVLRTYRRGGFAARLFERTYFALPWFGSPRPFAELEILAQLKRFGVQVPTPVAALVERLGGAAYRGWLLTGELEGVENLLVLARRDDPEGRRRASAAASGAGREAAKMLECGIYHPDLHLGNVLQAADETVYLIDFDKAAPLRDRSDLAQGRRRLADRWQRSIRRHAAFIADPAALESAFMEQLYQGAEIS